MRTILISLTLVISLFSSFSSFSQNVGKVGLDFEPKWKIDMSQYPGMHPSKAFEIESYNNLDLFGKIEFTKQAIEAQKINLKYDKTDPTVSREEIIESEKELKRLEQQLRDLENKNQPSV